MNIRDINDMMPKIDNMRWGALMNHAPTTKTIKDMDAIFPDNGRWHTVFEEDDFIIIDGKEVRKNNPQRWT